MSAALGQLSVGTAISELAVPVLTRSTLSNYADASGDHAAVHLDPEYARSVGFPDVIAHGLLVMAYLGRAVTSWAPVRELREFSCRFMAVTYVGDCLTCRGLVTAISEAGGERLAELDLRVVNQRDEVKIKGSATVVLRAG